jgi:hypothetical protein
VTCEEVLNYIIEINEGRCSISEDLISQKEDEEHQKILAGLMLLHEDLEHKKEQALITEKMRAAKALVITYNHEIRNSISVAKSLCHKLHKRGFDESSPEEILKIDGSIERTLEVLKKIEKLMEGDDIDFEDYYNGAEIINIHNK